MYDSYRKFLIEPTVEVKRGEKTEITSFVGVHGEQLISISIGEPEFSIFLKELDSKELERILLMKYGRSESESDVSKKIGEEMDKISYGSSGELFVQKTYKEGKIVSKEDTKEDNIPIRNFVHSNLAYVERQSRVVINMGNFETVTVTVGVRLPCYLEEIAEADRTAREFVDERLNEETKNLREFRDELKKG